MREHHDQKPDDAARAILEAHKALAASVPRFASEVARMESCIHNADIRTDASTDKARHRNSHRRCRGLLCGPCLRFRFDRDSSHILDSLNKSKLLYPDAHIALLTFTSKSYPLESASDCVDLAIQSWRRFSARKAIRAAMPGYVRGIYMPMDHRDRTVRCQVNVMAMADPYFVYERGGWLKLWNGKHCQSFLEHELHVPPGAEGADRLIQEFSDIVATVAVHPLEICEGDYGVMTCDAEKLAILKLAFRHRRLIQFGGCMRR